MTQRAIFDNERYLREQAEEIRQRILQFGDKLYLEFGGKLMFDYHAARVLPGYDPNIKIRLLQELKDQAEVLICIHAGDIERKKLVDLIVSEEGYGVNDYIPTDAPPW